MQTWRSINFPPHGIGSSKSCSAGLGFTMSFIMGVWDERLYLYEGQSCAAITSHGKPSTIPMENNTIQTNPCLEEKGAFIFAVLLGFLPAWLRPGLTKT